MSTSRKILIVGAFSEIIELCESLKFRIVGLIDSDINLESKYNLLGSDKDIENIREKYSKYPVVITPDQPVKRKVLCDLYKNNGFDFISIISKNAYISRSCTINAGVVVQSGVNISSNVSIGKFVKLNVGANIMHDSVIGSYSTIAPNAVILGRCRIGQGCYIGSNATILPGIEIGENAVVGAGAVVIRDIQSNLTVAGNPARIIGK